MRRVLSAAVLALLIASGVLVTQRAMNIGSPSQCANLDPDENWFLWWYYGCDGPAGGGGSGAGME